jgi:hypothetical protein
MGLSGRHTAEVRYRQEARFLRVWLQLNLTSDASPKTRMYLRTSPVAMEIAGLAIKFMFRFNKAVRRSSLHALDDAEEVKAFFYDLLNTGRELGVAMPVMASFEPDIKQFADKVGKQ